MDRQTLEAMVQDVNAGQVAPEERLSDHVYMYDSQEKELVLADKMEERQQQRAEAQKDAKEAEQVDKPGKAERGEKKPECKYVPQILNFSEFVAQYWHKPHGRSIGYVYKERKIS
jgi:hypothetical protein